MAALFKQVRFARHACLVQGAEQQQSVFHRDGLVLHGMPDEHRWCGGGDLILQRKALVGGNILRTGQLHKAVPVGVFPGGDHRVCQQQGVGPRLVCHAGDLPHRTGQCQMPAGRKAA